MNKYLQLFRPVVLLMGIVFLIAAAFIAAGSNIDDYLNDVVKKHELTREDKEQDLSLIHI